MGEVHVHAEEGVAMNEKSRAAFQSLGAQSVASPVGVAFEDNQLFIYGDEFV